jgi:hypothetical protein
MPLRVIFSNICLSYVVLLRLQLVFRLSLPFIILPGLLLFEDAFTSTFSSPSVVRGGLRISAQFSEWLACRPRSKDALLQPMHSPQNARMLRQPMHRPSIQYFKRRGTNPCEIFRHRQMP